MKKNKLLVPLAAMVGAAGVITPSVCLTSCKNGSDDPTPTPTVTPTAVLASSRFKFVEEPIVKIGEKFTCKFTNIVPGATGPNRENVIIYNNHTRVVSNFNLEENLVEGIYIDTLTFTEDEVVKGDIYICIEDPLMYYLDASAETTHKYEVKVGQENPHYGSAWTCEIHDANPDQDQYENSLPDATHITVYNKVPLTTAFPTPIRCEHHNYEDSYGVAHWYMRISLPSSGAYSKALGDIIVRVAPPL